MVEGSGGDDLMELVERLEAELLEDIDSSEEEPEWEASPQVVVRLWCIVVCFAICLHELRLGGAADKRNLEASRQFAKRAKATTSSALEKCCHGRNSETCELSSTILQENTSYCTCRHT